MHLAGLSESFHAYRALADYKDTGEGYIDVVIQKVPKGQSYDLELIDNDGSVHPIFANVPFDELDEWKDTSMAPPDDDPLAPEPEDTT